MFDHCLYFNTTALARRLEQEWAQAFASFGLTSPQAFMLRAVLNRPGMLQSELSEELSIARPTATRGLDSLESKGYIERRRKAGDGREICICPTSRAVRIAAALNEASGAVATKLKKMLGTAEFATTVATIRGVRFALN